jgi:glycerophosphoryl diester phosphodiesterase
MSNWLTASQPLIIAHRGASADAPENTLAAFALALEQQAGGVELDVQLSADGWPVIIHDDTVDRTSNGSGLVSQMSVAELQSLDLGLGQTVPTLDELFEAFGPSLLYNVEIKSDGLLRTGLRDTGLEAADRIEAHHLQSHVLVSSFDPFCVRRARRYLSRTTPVAFLRESRAVQLAHHLLPAEADHPYYQLVDAPYMAWARKRGLRVNVWTVDDAADAQRLVNLGVHGIITNKPAFIRMQLSGLSDD